MGEIQQPMAITVQKLLAARWGFLRCVAGVEVSKVGKHQVLDASRNVEEIEDKILEDFVLLTV